MRLVDADNIRVPNDERYKGSLRRLIAQQPTAYDIEKAERKLEQNSFLIDGNDDSVKVIDLETALDIVDECINEKENEEWLNSEYVEKPTLTKEEHMLCETLKEGYIVRYNKGALFVHAVKPIRSSCGWLRNGTTVKLDENIFKNVKFEFINAKDLEPWSVEDLLKLEVEK